MSVLIRKGTQKYMSISKERPNKVLDCRKFHEFQTTRSGVMTF